MRLTKPMDETIRELASSEMTSVSEWVETAIEERIQRMQEAEEDWKESKL